MKKRNILIGWVLFILVFVILISIYAIKVNQKKYYCKITKTYSIENIIDSQDYDFIYVTLKSFQDEDIQTIKIKRNKKQEILAGNNYEFTFEINKKIEIDSILSIYNNSNIISVRKTDKTGLELTNEDLCN